MSTKPIKMEEGEDISHEEMWDDSALIASWNQALDEYKKYHSIHAKGGSLKDLEKAVESSTTAQPIASGHTQGAGGKENIQGDSGGHNDGSIDHRQEDSLGTKPRTSVLPPGPPPQAVLGTVQDENLKKLLMSWYYAGYYTGLYEGQQQSQQ